MPSPTSSDPNAKLQIDKFHEMARELSCDEDAAAFKVKLARIARQKPKEDRQEVRGGATDADQS